MLDALDRELVTQLQKSGRLSHVAMGKLLGVSERTVRNRMRNLLNKGVIRVAVLPSLDTLGYDFMGIVGLQIELGKLKSIGKELAKHPNVCYIVNVTGQYDFIVIVVAKSSKEFADIMENFVSLIPGILRTETYVCLDTYKGEKGNIDTSQLIGILSSRTSPAKKTGIPHRS